MKGRSGCYDVKTSEVHSEVAQSVHWSRVRLFKNLLLVSLCIFLYLCAAIPSSSLQSSLNIEGGWGTTASSVGTAVHLVPAIFLPTYLIRRFGLKTSIWVSLFLGSMSFFGNFYPRWYTLIPSSILCNVGTVPMWTAKGTYITHVAQDYAFLSGQSSQTAANLFFGIFYFIFYSAFVAGNLLPFYLLEDLVVNTTMINVTQINCGFEFCDSEIEVQDENFARPPKAQVYLLFGVFAAMTLLGAILIWLFLDPLPLDHETEATWSRTLDSLRLLGQWEQVALCLLSLYRGLNRALLTADFTKAYITCTFGMSHIGYFMISFGLGCCLFSLVLGCVVRWTGRPVLFLFAIVSNMVLMVTLAFWKPHSDQTLIFFGVVSVWGASSAVWEAPVSALNLLLFPMSRDAAYTNYGNAESVGHVIGTAISAPWCMDMKVYANMAVLGVASIAYVTLEAGPIRAQERKDAKTKCSSEKCSNNIPLQSLS